MVGSSVGKIVICCSVVGESADGILFDCSVVLIVDGCSVIEVAGFSVVSYSLYLVLYAEVVVNCSFAV